MRTRVLWVLKGLGPGGAERLLVEHARVGDRTTFDYEVAYLLPWKQHLVPVLEGLGVRTHCLDVRSTADPRWITRLLRVIREGRFDVVHFHSPALAALARPALRAVRPRPAIVTTEHNRWPSYHPVTRAANRATSRLDDVTLAVSEDVKASMGSAGADVEVVVHGVDIEALRSQGGARAEVRAELGIGDGELLALTIANLRVDKAYDDLLAAAWIVRDAGAPVRFAAAGQGPLEEQLRAEVVARGLDGTFTFLGYVPDAARLLAGADVFVLASHHEGLPVAVMEALTMGVPVVATRVGGLPELVDDGVSGRLVPPRAPEALAAAILELTNEETRRRLAAGALARGDSVDGRAAVARIEELYRDLAARRR